MQSDVSNGIFIRLSGRYGKIKRDPPYKTIVHELRGQTGLYGLQDLPEFQVKLQLGLTPEPPGLTPEPRPQSPQWRTAAAHS